MANFEVDLRFAILPMVGDGSRPSEFARTMRTHPLIHQELPYAPQYTVYNHRLTAMTMTNRSAHDAYWRLRRQAILRHTGELPIEIRGPDAERLLNLVFTREIAKQPVGRCSYQIACYHDGGMIIDGVLVRLSEQRFWYGQADGDLTDWLRAHAPGMDVEILDPDIWVSQVQGPESLRILEAAVDDGYPTPFRYFDAARVTIAGQSVVISRTGFTNELGWEIYFEPGIDARAVGDRLLDVGAPFGLTPVAIGGARRIEAGLLNAGSDFDASVTPFEAGLGSMVRLDKDDFIGKKALEKSDKRRRTWGLRVPEDVARLGDGLRKDGAIVGRVCSTAWSPFLQCGVAIVRLDDPTPQPGAAVEAECEDGATRSGELCDMPMYDAARQIPRGELIDVPDLPEVGDPR